MRNHLGKLAVSNLIFSAAIIVLIVVAAAGFGLYAQSLSKTTSSSTASEMMEQTTTTSEIMANSSSEALMFKASSGAMISDAWLIFAPLGMNEYAISIHAEGLEPSGDYIVEGALSSGSMQVVPISTDTMNMNTTSGSEFQADQNGTATYWITLDGNPVATFESIELVYLPGMSMQNATVVATVSLSQMMTSETTTMMQSSS